MTRYVRLVTDVTDVNDVGSLFHAHAVSEGGAAMVLAHRLTMPASR